MGSGVHERIAPISNIEVVEESGRPKNWEDGVKYAARLASDRSVSTNPYELQKLVSELRRALNKLDGGDEGSAK